MTFKKTSGKYFFCLESVTFDIVIGDGCSGEDACLGVYSANVINVVDSRIDPNAWPPHWKPGPTRSRDTLGRFWPRLIGPVGETCMTSPAENRYQLLQAPWHTAEN